MGNPASIREKEREGGFRSVGRCFGHGVVVRSPQVLVDREELAFRDGKELSLADRRTGKEGLRNCGKEVNIYNVLSFARTINALTDSRFENNVELLSRAVSNLLCFRVESHKDGYISPHGVVKRK